MKVQMGQSCDKNDHQKDCQVTRKYHPSGRRNPG